MPPVGGAELLDQVVGLRQPKRVRRTVFVLAPGPVAAGLLCLQSLGQHSDHMQGDVQLVPAQAGAAEAASRTLVQGGGGECQASVQRELPRWTCRGWSGRLTVMQTPLGDVLVWPLLMPLLPAEDGRT